MWVILISINVHTYLTIGLEIRVTVNNVETPSNQHHLKPLWSSAGRFCVTMKNVMMMMMMMIMK